MRRLADFGRDLACYFGIGAGSSRASDSEQPEATLLSVLVRLVPVLVVAIVLRSVLGLDDVFTDFTDILAWLGLLIVLAVIWGLVLRLASARWREVERD